MSGKPHRREAIEPEVAVHLVIWLMLLLYWLDGGL